MTGTGTGTQTQTQTQTWTTGVTTIALLVLRTGELKIKYFFFFFFFIVKMAAKYAKIDRVDSLNEDFKQVPLLHSEIFTILLWNVNNLKLVKKAIFLIHCFQSSSLHRSNPFSGRRINFGVNI